MHVLVSSPTLAENMLGNQTLGHILPEPPTASVQPWYQTLLTAMTSFFLCHIVM